MRALWLHFPDDPQAVARADEYLFGGDLLVAPVVEKGATSRTLYLPRGTWYDFWTGEKQEGGREMTRNVDLSTMPVYVRAGAVLPTGPVRQYTAEKVDGPLTLTVFPGAGGFGFLYEDDGETFDFRQGAFMRVELRWDDVERKLSLRMATGSRALRPIPVEIKLAGSDRSIKAVFTGDPLTVTL
jgi:alpha-glucosidase/alpha-D-xyloside xylohydrolase